MKIDWKFEKFLFFNFICLKIKIEKSIMLNYLKLIVKSSQAAKWRFGWLSCVCLWQADTAQCQSAASSAALEYLRKSISSNVVFVATFSAPFWLQTFSNSILIDNIKFLKIIAISFYKNNNIVCNSIYLLWY